MARKGSYDFSKGAPRTGGAVRRTSQEEIDAARVRAAGAEPPPYDPVRHAAAGRKMEDNASRLVMGRYDQGGHSPMTVLHPDQFAELQATGDVAGLWPGYGPESAAPDDREWKPL